MTKSKNKNSQQQSDKDYLTKSKEQFKKELSERLTLGDNLLGRTINTADDLAKFKLEHSYWNNINEEILKQSFTNTNNAYYLEYTRSYISTPFYSSGHQQSFQDSVKNAKDYLNVKYHRLKMIYEKIDHLQLLREIEDFKIEESEDIKMLSILENILNKFHKVAQTLRQRYNNRQTIIINDEYDVQDLLRGLLRVNFEDIREEDYVPSYAGSNSRVDFVLKDQEIIIETKITSDRLSDKEIGSQLLIDIGRYRNHPNCKTLVCFIYDKGDHIINKVGLKSDLEKMSSEELKVKIFINPK